MFAAICAIALLGVGGGCPGNGRDSAFANGVIGPNGGTISSPDAVLTIAIPPGALEEELEFFVEGTSQPPPAFGRAYLVRPNPELRLDATVTYRAGLPDDPSRAAIGYVDPIAFEEGMGQWNPLPVIRVDAEQGVVSGVDTQISVFYTLLAGVGPGSSDDGPSDDGPSDDGPSDDGTDTGPAMTDGGTTSGGSTGDESDGGDTTSDSGSTGEPAVSFAREIQPILTANCNCHIKDMPMGLSFVDGYGNLVDVASTEVPGLDRIEPGDTEASYLWHKINNTHLTVGGEGNPMPAPDGGLDPALIDTIEAWILDGAAP